MQRTNIIPTRGEHPSPRPLSKQVVRPAGLNRALVLAAPRWRPQVDEKRPTRGNGVATSPHGPPAFFTRAPPHVADASAVSRRSPRRAGLRKARHPAGFGNSRRHQQCDARDTDERVRYSAIDDSVGDDRTLATDEPGLERPALHNDSGVRLGGPGGPLGRLLLHATFFTMLVAIPHRDFGGRQPAARATCTTDSK